VDYFSKQAISSLAKVLPIWSSWSTKAVKHFADSVYPLPDIKTKFIGYTVNNFNINKQRPARAVQSVIDELDSDIKNKLIPALEKTENIVSRDNYCLGEINNFNTLQQVSHRVHKPVFKLTSDDTGNSGFLADNQGLTIENFKDKFYKLAEVIIEVN
jgi:hypothetical protein